jgi:hypothetical protein
MPLNDNGEAADELSDNAARATNVPMTEQKLNAEGLRPFIDGFLAVMKRPSGRGGNPTVFL